MSNSLHEVPPNNAPLISVIIPAYNRMEFIEETIESVLQQTYKNIEIIVVDDGSKDNTADIVKTLGNRIKYYYKENSGVSATRNYGIKESKGDFLYFLDADDIITKEQINNLYTFLKEHQNIDLVFSNYQNFDENGLYSLSHFQTCPQLWKVINAKDNMVLKNACSILIEENFGIASSFLMRRKLLMKVPEFNTKLSGSEDFYFYYQLCRDSEIGILNKIGMKRRIHDNNLSANTLNQTLAELKSRTFLLNSETNKLNRIKLKQTINSRILALSRAYANKSDFRNSFKYAFKSLFKNFSIKSIVNLGRTLMLVVGIYSNKDQ